MSTRSKQIGSVVFASIFVLFIIFPLIVAAADQAEFTRKPATYSSEWGSETVSYTHTPKLIEYFRTYSPHGLAFQNVWLTANVIDEDGNKFDLVREYNTTVTSWMLASQQFLGLESAAKPIFKKEEIFLGRIYHELDQAKGLIFVKPYSPGESSFSITIKPQQVVWKDANGRIDLEFKALGPALVFYTPGQLEDAMYLTEPYLVEGTLNGKKVIGHGAVDVGWGTVGVGFIQGKIYCLLEEEWIIWLNIYADGSKESGVFINGVDQFRVGYFNKNGEAKATHDNKLQNLSFTPNGFIKGVSMKMDELQFEYTSESKVMQLGYWVSWATGHVRNVNDPRKPIKTFAICEFFPKSKKWLEKDLK